MRQWPNLGMRTRAGHVSECGIGDGTLAPEAAEFSSSTFLRGGVAAAIPFVSVDEYFGYLTGSD